jgi:nicotinamide/nicotinate riboside kinase
VIDSLDVRAFIRVPEEVLKQRRHERHGYHTAGKLFVQASPSSVAVPHSLRRPGLTSPKGIQPTLPVLRADALPLLSIPAHRPYRHTPFGHGVQSDPEGALWRDPPNYWEQIVWPAYVKAHSSILEGADMDTAEPSGKVKDLVLIEGTKQSMGEMVEEVCKRLVKTV